MERMAPARSSRRTCRARLAAVLVCGTSLAAVVPAPAQASNDPFSPQLWGLAKIQAEAAWGRTTGAGVKIGIVDSGVDRNHQDLGGRIAAAVTCNGTNGQASQCNGDGSDIDGHGTHVTGTAVANANNGVGVAGVAPSAQAVVARVFRKNSNGDVTATIDDIEAGVRWVVSQGAKVVNLSLGVDSAVPLIFGSGADTLEAAIEYAWANDAIPVIAGGNGGGDLLSESENYGTMNAVVVGATGPNDEKASYSSDLGNAKWGVSAPGGASGSDTAKMIVSTWPGNKYSASYGTSMAAPHVSGVLAMLRATGLGKQAAVDRLLSTANKSVSHPGRHHHGRVDAAAAVGTPPAPSGGAPTAGGGGAGTTAPAPRARRAAAATTAPGPAAAAPEPAPDAAAVPEVSVVDGDDRLEVETPSDDRRRRGDELAADGDADGGDDGAPAVAIVLAVLALAGAGVPAGVTLQRRRRTVTTLP